MSAVKLLVLGSMLRRGVSHGYGVYSDITSWRADTWTNVKPGSIYHALEKLEVQGKIKAEGANGQIKLGPSRTEYSVTEEGKKEFHSLLAAALRSNDIQLFASGIALMELASRETVARLLSERQAALEQSAAFLKTLPTESVPSDPSKHPELVGLWIRYVEDQAAATQAIAANVKSGKYRFTEEQDKERMK